jgi:hypothetical protein
VRDFHPHSPVTIHMQPDLVRGYLWGIFAVIVRIYGGDPESEEPSFLAGHIPLKRFANCCRSPLRGRHQSRPDEARDRTEMLGTIPVAGHINLAGLDPSMRIKPPLRTGDAGCYTEV